MSPWISKSKIIGPESADYVYNQVSFPFGYSLGLSGNGISWNFIGCDGLGPSRSTSLPGVFEVVARADLASSQSGDAGNPKHVTRGPKATRTMWFHAGFF